MILNQMVRQFVSHVSIYRRPRLARAFVAALAVGLTPLSEVAGEAPSVKANVTGFLNQQSQRNQVGIDPDSIPTSWSPELVRWEASLTGYGQSSPLVWGDHIYVTSVDGPNKDQLVLSCVKLSTGELGWERKLPSSRPVESGPMVSRAAPTPVCDEAGVYVFFESGDFVAFDHQGEERWKLSLCELYGDFENKFGLSASLAQSGQLVYVLVDHSGPSYLTAINKSDGQVAWRVDRGTRGHSWTSPAVVHDNNGNPLLVVSSLGSIDGYQLQTGEPLFKFTDVGGNSVATPIDCGAGRFMVSSLIRPADGPVEGATRSNMMVQINASSEGYELRPIWIAKEARGSFSSPVMSGSYCYWVNPQGALFCLNAETGEEHYVKRLPCGGCWATPLVIGDRLYCFGRDGETTVVRTGTDYEEISSGNRLWADDAPAASGEVRGAPARPAVYAALVIEGGFLVRRGDRLYRVGH
jgi:outer membrane protein assembly factor BamB